MATSTSHPQSPPGLHVAIIMDGNGRWAAARGLPRLAGHRAGGETVRRVVEASPGLGIGTLTLYAFSSDNWRRPPAEVAGLMQLLRTYLSAETDKCVKHGVRLAMIGRRDRLPPALVRAVKAAENATSGGRVLDLRIAVDYSSRDAILRAARLLRSDGAATREDFARALASAEHSPCPAPQVDLLIRTSGEQRLSDFLLWEAAYAELYFTPVLWPDFTAASLESALTEFRRRERRFGGLPAAVAV